MQKKDKIVKLKMNYLEFNRVVLEKNVSISLDRKSFLCYKNYVESENVYSILRTGEVSQEIREYFNNIELHPSSIKIPI